MTYANGAVYVGDWRINKFHGQGTLTYPNLDYYKGDFVEGKRHGMGLYFTKMTKTI